MIKKLLFAAILFITSISITKAQQLNYQGIARNANGVAISFQDVSIRLTIRDLITLGPTLYSETRLVRTNQFGLINVVIGSPGAINTIGSIGAINWAGTYKYLQVEIDPLGGTSFQNAGTSQLQSVPYAFFANTAYPVGSAGGDLLGSTYPNPIIAPMAVTTNKLGDTAVTNRKIADSAVTTEKIIDSAITTAKLRNKGVTNEKIADSAINNAKIKNGAITNEKIIDGSIQNIKLVNSVITLNGLVLNLGGSQSFVVDSVGTDVNIASANNIHRFNFPNASITNRGLITTTTQTIGGNKIFNNNITAGSFIRNGGIAAQFLKADGSVDNNIYLMANLPIIVTATGDATGISTSSGTAPILPLTLARVNSNVGNFGTSISIPSITVNAKGLVTAASSIPIPTATASFTGLLNSLDWNTFNSKQNAISLGTTAQYFRGDLSLSNFQTDVRAQLSAGTNISLTNGIITNTSPMTYPSSGIALSNGTNWAGSITNNSSNWNTAFDDRFKWDGGPTSLIPATGRTSLGGTIVGSNFFTLSDPNAIAFPRINLDNSISTLSATAFRTAIGVTESSNTWNTSGNSNLIEVTNFLGTLDLRALRFRVNSLWAGEINPSTTNTSFGIGAGQNNSSSINANNTAFGVSALNLNTSDGLDNTAIGQSALQNNISGDKNTAIGQGALKANNNSSNTAVGQAAMQTNTSGFNNTAIGKDALFSNLSGENNTAIGQGAAQIISSGSRNTALGQNSLSTTTGDENVGLGYNALVSAGSSNSVSIGSGANVSSNNSVAIGSSATNSITNSIQLGGAANTLVTATGALTATGRVTGSGAKFSFVSTNGNLTLTINNYYVKVTGLATITLPSATGQEGQRYVIANKHVADITINSASLIEGYDLNGISVILPINKNLIVFSDGTNWIVETNFK